MEEKEGGNGNGKWDGWMRKLIEWGKERANKLDFNSYLLTSSNVGVNMFEFKGKVKKILNKTQMMTHKITM
jgi:hypothetical protein